MAGSIVPRAPEIVDAASWTLPPPPVRELETVTLMSAPPPVHEQATVTLISHPPPVHPEEPEHERVVVVAPRGEDSGLSATVIIRRPRKGQSSVPPPIARG